MKKRLISAVCLLAVILLTAVWSSLTMRKLDKELTVLLNQVVQSAEDKNWQQSEQFAVQAHTLLESKRTLLAYFLAHTLLSDLDSTLSTLPTLAHLQDDSLFAETERARSQLQALSLLFFRTL